MGRRLLIPQHRYGQPRPRRPRQQKRSEQHQVATVSAKISKSDKTSKCEYSKKVEDIWGPIGKTRSMQVSVGVGEKIHLSHLAMASEWKWDGCRIRSKSGGWCMHALSVSSSLSFFLGCGFSSAVCSIKQPF